MTKDDEAVLKEKLCNKTGGPNDAVYARMGSNDWRVMSRWKAEQYKYTEIISAGIPYPGRLESTEEVSDD